MDTRERLVQAMSMSMRERGYGSSSMKDVLNEADVTAGSMYHFFPQGKEQLAVAAVREAGMASARQLAEVIEVSPSVAEGTVVFFESLIEDMESAEFRYGCPVGVPTTEAPEQVNAMRDAAAEVYTAWVDAIAAGLVDEGWTVDDSRQAARFSIAAYEGASTLARATADASYIRDSLAMVKAGLEVASPE